MGTAGIAIGTSGWHYAHWSGPFYPEDLPKARYLDYYAQHFATVELNNTFYRLPPPEQFAAWRDSVPTGFVFAVKANRYITHMKRLKDPETSLKRFLDAVAALAPKLGPILFQLPPRWRLNEERLQAFLAALPSGFRYAFEFRDESWFAEPVYQALERHNVAFCLYDLAGRHSPTRVTADMVYLRLHGPGAAYQGSYDGRALAGWARRIRRWRSEGRSVYCYFDNDEKGYAVRDALRLKAMLEDG